jgi:hypothetical protein
MRTTIKHPLDTLLRTKASPATTAKEPDLGTEVRALFFVGEILQSE